MRWPGALARALGTGAVFVFATAVGAVTHLDVPAVRRVVVDRVNRALGSSFAGKVTLERVGGLGSTRVDGIDAHVDDPEGKTVLRLEDVRARVSTFALVRSLAGGGDLVVEVPELSVSRAEVLLDSDESGTMRIARAFASPRTSPSLGPSRGVRFALPRIRIGHAFVHGQAGGVPRIDADIDDLVGGLLATPAALAIDVAQARLVERGLPGDATARGTGEAHLMLPSPQGRDLAVRATWVGTVNAIAGSAQVTYDGGEVGALLDVPDAKPEEVRSLWPECPFTEAASAHVEARGTLPELVVRARASVGHGRIAMDGPWTFDKEVRARLRVEATSIDAHALSVSAPPSDATVSGDVSLVLHAGGAVSGDAVLDAAGGTVGATRVPPGTLRGAFAYDPAGESRTTATATVAIREPGAPTDLTLHLLPNGKGLQLRFEGRTRIARFADIPWLAPIAGGQATARAAGTLDLTTDRLVAQVQGTADDVAFARIRLRGASLDAQVTGRLASPAIDVDLRGDALDAGPVRLRGLHARADVALDGGVTLRDVVLSAEGDGQQATARASLVRVSNAEIRVDDAVLEGLGAPLRATVRQSATGTLTVQARSRGLDVGRLARLAGVPQVSGGRLSLDVDASLRGKAGEGRVVLDLSKGTAAGWPETSAHVDVRLEGRRVSGRATATVGDAGSIEVQPSILEVAGSERLTWSSWRRVWGALDVDAHVDLAKFTARLPAGALRLRSVGGELDIHARLQRDSLADDTPDVDVTVRTKDLVLAGKSTPWLVAGVDATVHTRVDGETGRTVVDARLADAKGDLALLTASSAAVPFARLLGTNESALDALRTMPFDADVTVPSRDLDTLPAALGMQGNHGLIEATVGWRGTLSAPTVDVTADLREGRTDVRMLSLPREVDLAAHYDGAHAVATLRASGRKGRILDASASLDARAADMLAGLRGARVPWVASARAHLSRFPLQNIGVLGDRQVRGHASGDLTLDKLHEDARATLALTVDDLQVGDITCRAASVQAAVDGRSFDASTRIELDEGFAEARAHLGARWADAMAPAIDASQPATWSLSAKEFNVEVLEPFVSGVLTDLDGHVTGEAHVEVDPLAKTVKPQGTLSFEGGTFQLIKLGGEFHDVSATLVLTPDGIVRLKDATARGLSGRLQAAATARFNGLAFGGARAVLQVPQKEPLPIVFDGVQVGMVDGRFDVTVAPSTDLASLDMSVDVPTMHVRLPLASSHEVQPLDDIDGVRVGIRRSPTEFVTVPLDGNDDESAAPAHPMPVRIAVKLGSDVEVKRGTDLDVHLEGAPTFTLADEVRASGQIRLQSGTIDVQGKAFTLENGTVTFVGDDPSNPQVALTALWTAPDGTLVYAEFRGPLKTGKVTFRSDPARSQNEVLALILFGTSDTNTSGGGTGAQTSAAAGAAGGAAGGAATQPINRMLDSFGLAGGISTKIDTSSTTPRPEVELRIARDITLQIALVLGIPPPGSNPDTALATLNWRFVRKWSLETTVGNAGSSIVDVIWQHRY